MEFEFDKEIDAILRKARAGEVVTSPNAHLDADEISAFAENALPDRIRQFYTAHFADCTRCRKILSNVIALNSEAETETASSIVPAKIAEAKTPWYRKLFVFPQLAYAMGALVVLFSGFFGYLVLKNVTNSGNSEVSFSTEKPNQMDKSAPQAAPTVSSSSDSNKAAAATNSSAPANASAPTSATPFSASNTATANTSPAKTTAPTERKTSEERESDAPVVAPQQPTPVLDEKPRDDVTKGEDTKALAKNQPMTEANKPNASGATIQEKDKRKEKKETYSTDDQLSAGANEQKLKTPRATPNSPKKQVSEAGKARSVGGKTFNNVGGIWFDSAYTNQKQKTVNRGTNDYQKLDSGLRSIADQFSGTVVVLWKSKAYRIQ